MSENSQTDELQNKARELEISIRNGNSEHAAKLAQYLALQRVQCCIKIHEKFGAQDDLDTYNGGWTCSTCTFINIPNHPGCEMCFAPRPYVNATTDSDAETVNYWQDVMQENQNTKHEQFTREIETGGIFDELVRLDGQPIIWTVEEFECPICMTPVKSGEGIVIRECHHSYCKECLVKYISLSEKTNIDCPYQDAAYMCECTLLDREIKALVSPDVYEKYQQRSMVAAERADPNTFHCRTVNCTGWCFFEDDANEFMCPVCSMINCLTCRAIHESKPCNEYQEWLKRQAQCDEEARKTQEALETMVETGEALHCPFCAIIIQKKGGCDWVQCSVCRKEICWITKGPRWGKEGRGDTSGGCKCRINGVPCHPNCKNCH